MKGENIGYLIKSNVINALEEDMHDTMMRYEGKREKDIIAFSYKSMERTIEDLPQYWPDNVFENTGLTPEQIMKLKERVQSSHRMQSGRVPKMRRND